jgi:hypothetical protein
MPVLSSYDFCWASEYLVRVCGGVGRKRRNNERKDIRLYNYVNQKFFERKEESVSPLTAF